MADTFTEALVKLLEPMIYGDVAGTDLPIYLGGLGELFQVVEDYASDGPNGEPGYSLLIDADRVPDEAIMWLAQFVGVKITQGLSAVEQRAQLIGLGNWKRGTVAAIQAAPVPYLTGSQTVIVKERDTGSAYHFQVITYSSETPDTAAATAALIAAKPGGDVMDYVVFSGQKAFLMRNSVMRGSPLDEFRLAV